MFARWRYQLEIRQLVFGGVHQNAAVGTKFAIYECRVGFSGVDIIELRGAETPSLRND